MRNKILFPALFCLLILFNSFSPVLSFPHENMDEALNDPEALLSYFTIDIQRATAVFSYLSYEDFENSKYLLSFYSSHLEALYQTILELKSKEIEVPLISFYAHFNSLYELLSSALGHEKLLVEHLKTLESSVSGDIDPQDLIDAKNELLIIRENTSFATEEIYRMNKLGFETGDLEDAYNQFLQNVNLYANRISYFEGSTTKKFTFFAIHASKPNFPFDNYLHIFGVFYYNGEPVAENPIGIFIDETEEATVATDTTGVFAYDYVMPSDIKTNIVNISAKTTYKGETYESNTVKVDLHIWTILTLDRAYDVIDDHVKINFEGRLKDVFGNSIGSQEIILTVNNESYILATDPDGNYFYELVITSEKKTDILAFAEFYPKENAPYTYSESPILKFTIEESAYLEEPLLLPIASGVVSVIVLFLLILIIKKREKNVPVPADAPRGVEEQKTDKIVDKETFEKEIILLRKMGNFKEAIIVGYLKFLDFLESENIVKIWPHTTHLDIDKQIKKISIIREKSGIITKTFEVSRYSKRDITDGIAKRFFDSILFITQKIGGIKR